jgi:hypothetical protein
MGPSLRCPFKSDPGLPATPQMQYLDIEVSCLVGGVGVG